MILAIVKEKSEVAKWPTLECEACNNYVSGEPEATLEHLVRCEAGETNLDRATTIKRIRTALQKRSGKAWSVTGGTGTAWGWITISAPPRRRVNGSMTEADAAELGKLLGKDAVHHQGESVPASDTYYAEYVARAEGRTPNVYGTQYWD